MGYGGWEVKTCSGLPRFRTSCRKEMQDVQIQRTIRSVNVDPKESTDYLEVNRCEKPPDSGGNQAHPSGNRSTGVFQFAVAPLSIRRIPYFSTG